MANVITLPKLGQTMEEGVIVEWLKKEGDPVNRGDVLFQVESDKAVLEAESRYKGVLLKILVGPNTKVPVLTPVGIVGEPGEDISALLGGEANADKAESGQPTPQAEAAGEPGAATPSEAGERPFSSPRARRLAREEGVDLSLLSGTGPGGRIIEQDVQAYLSSRPAATPLAEQIARELGVPLPQPESDASRVRADALLHAAAEPSPTPSVTAAVATAAPTALTGLRGIIAERMVTSAQTTAAVTLQSHVDATQLVIVRERLKEALAPELGFNIGYNDLLAVIVARCLIELPYMNVQLGPEGIRQMPHVNIGLAVDSPRGLLVPVVHEAETLGVREFAARFRDLVARAREGKSQPDDLTGGTFTITNLGMFGVDAFTPIINLPESAILGVGRIQPEPTVIDGQVVIRQRMWLSLTFDHRVVDGAPAARFLQAIARYVQEPYLLLA
ncbi:MAG: dihydrolipoamide acetyltransferase family protein [Anaerolineales bacterium]